MITITIPKWLVIQMSPNKKKKSNVLIKFDYLLTCKGLRLLVDLLSTRLKKLLTPPAQQVKNP